MGTVYLATTAAAYQQLGRHTITNNSFCQTVLVHTTLFITRSLFLSCAGSGVKGFLPFSLPNGPTKTIIGVLLCFHIIVSYMLCGQPLCYFLLEQWKPGSQVNTLATLATLATLSLAFHSHTFLSPDQAHTRSASGLADAYRYSV
jgi:hypothetical protein